MPELGRALLSTRNDLTLMVEDELQPFQREGSAVKTSDMKLHRLPWPREHLAGLGAAPVAPESLDSKLRRSAPCSRYKTIRTSLAPQPTASPECDLPTLSNGFVV